MKKHCYSLVVACTVLFSVQGSVLNYINVSNVKQRFYHIERLINPMKALTIFNEKKMLQLPEKESYQLEKTLFQKCALCEDDILTMVHLMHMNESVHYLFDVWKSLYSYRHLGNGEVVREFVCVVVYMIEDVIKRDFNFHYENLSENVKSRLDKGLEDLPLEDVLDILDILVEEIPEFIEEYQLDSEMTWNDWLKKYWLVAPVAFAAICLKAYLSAIAN